MSTNNEEPARRAALADDEVKSLLAQIADAVRKGSERERSIADKFWERMASKAAARANEIGTWGIVIGHDDSLNAARDEVERATTEGFTAAVYKKGKWFVTVVGGRLGLEQVGFANEDDAASANFEISRPIREETQIVPLKRWCENPRAEGEVTNCSNRDGLAPGR